MYKIKLQQNKYMKTVIITGADSGLGFKTAKNCRNFINICQNFQNI